MNLTDDDNILLGHDWLQIHNPHINWANGAITLNKCSDSCLDKWYKELKKDDKLYIMDVQGYMKKQNNAWDIWKSQEGKLPQFKLEYPEQYLTQYSNIFSEEEFDRLPPQRPWDHCNELNADFKPVNCKIYALTWEE